MYFQPYSGHQVYKHELDFFLMLKNYINKDLLSWELGTGLCIYL